MFSQLGPLFKATFRQAESNDTRQKIPHEERDLARKKDEEEKKSETHIELWEDNTSVSIQSLRAFLINFLKELPDAENLDIPENKPREESYTRPTEKNRPTNTQNAKAVRAYQAQAAQAPPASKNTDKVGEPKKPRPQTIENKEMRDIYQLIDNLETLSGRGVEMLVIEKNGDFLTSLRSSVQKTLEV